MPKLFLKWSLGNTKVNKLKKRFGKTVTFSLPAYKSKNGFLVCKGAQACISVCYAQQGFFVMPTKIKAMEHNLKIARKGFKPFLKALVNDITQIKPGLIRVHDSGDFIDLDNLNAWKEAARRFPDIRFYAYTKNLQLPIYENLPSNFSIVQSEGGKWDSDIDESKPHARIFSSQKAMKEAGYQNGSNTDYLAITGRTNNIGLKYHGTRNLTEAQEKYFS